MQRFPCMRRRFVAAAWVVGATVPLLLTTIFVVGCCVLPFHRVMHQVVPLCHIAANAPDDAQPSAPAQQKQEPVKRIITTLTGPMSLPPAETQAVRLTVSAATGYRSFITLGAVRCDRDVGLHVLVATFLI